MKIPFNKPYLTGKETAYIQQAVASGKISGNGMFTKKCQQYFEEKYGFQKCLLTSSCSDALEMAALLLRVEEGDEIIMPAFTFVSTANAFVLRGAKIVFADVEKERPNLDISLIESLITERTKAIVVVHYGGMACAMNAVMKLAEKYGLFVVEDAAHALDSFYEKKALGGIGHLATFSFHETKNIISGEGGMLVINDKQFLERAEVIWEKGTNRSAFFRGEIDKYGWVDVGSSFLPSDVIAAFLFAQLENFEDIQERRIQIWQRYQEALQDLAKDGFFDLPNLPDYATNNGHLFYLILPEESIRHQLIQYLKEKNILAVFHYVPLHLSTFYHDKHDGRALPMTVKYSDCLLRLPFYYELAEAEQDFVIQCVKDFFKQS